MTRCKKHNKTIADREKNTCLDCIEHPAEKQTGKKKED